MGLGPILQHKTSGWGRCSTGVLSSTQAKSGSQQGYAFAVLDPLLEAETRYTLIPPPFFTSPKPLPSSF
jgi:hypothetical protein